ncbi:MAG: hypothetical protein IJD65_03320 [Mailhella sp.]|nr:hypothetical protein [Mailhella sp.]
MFKIERIAAPNLAKTRFRLKSVNNLDFCTVTLTLFGRTWRIKYSAKFNYFFIARQVRRERLMIDALSQSYLRQIIQLETGKKLTSFERLNTVGCCTDYYFRGCLDGQDVFVKALLSRLATDTGTGPAMLNEYEKSVLLSEECRYVPKPLHYIQCLPCEIIITPFIQNIRPLQFFIDREAPIPTWMYDQLKEIAGYLSSKRLVHRDLNGSNISVGSIAGGTPQLFLNDLAYMTWLDDNGNVVPTNLEKKVQKYIQPAYRQDDEFMFNQLLTAVKNKIEADAQKHQ